MDDADDLVFVSATPPDEAVAKALVEQRMTACRNILGPMRSVYRWYGAVQVEREIPLLIKTRRTLTDAVVTIARDMHPYEVPCFLILPIASVDAPYLQWALQQTQTP